jgi:DNA-binding NtrC family response regulator
VLSAADGHAAMSIFRAHDKEIAAVVLDLTLHGIANAEALQEIELIRSRTPVILTSVCSLDEAGVAPNLSIAGFLRKPYRIGELIALLQTAIPAPKRQRPSARAGL